MFIIYFLSPLETKIDAHQATEQIQTAMQKYYKMLIVNYKRLAQKLCKMKKKNCLKSCRMAGGEAKKELKKGE